MIRIAILKGKATKLTFSVNEKGKSCLGNLWKPGLVLQMVLLLELLLPPPKPVYSIIQISRVSRFNIMKILVVSFK